MTTALTEAGAPPLGVAGPDAETEPAAETEPNAETEPSDEQNDDPDDEHDAEHDGAEHDDPDVPDEPPAPARGLSESELEKGMQRLEKEASRHANRISEILGEDAQVLELCPRCMPHIPGFIYPPHIAPPPPEVVQAVKLSIGEQPLPGYRTSTTTRICDTCDGLGRLLSGSQVPGQELIACTACPNGRGWVLIGEGQAEPKIALSGQTVEEPTVVGAVENEPDPWGRDPSNPNYGRLPQYER